MENGSGSPECRLFESSPGPPHVRFGDRSRLRRCMDGGRRCLRFATKSRFAVTASSSRRFPTTPEASAKGVEKELSKALRRGRCFAIKLRFAGVES